MEDIEKLIADYQPSDATKRLIQETKIASIVGITGAGKDSIMNLLLASPDYYKIISHTTRAPRDNNGQMEKNGVDYYFINENQARTMLARHEFIEAKFVHGTIYGTSTAEYEKALASNKIAINDIDVQGVHEFRKISEKAKAIFIVPPSYDTWQERLLARYEKNMVTNEELAKRTESAIKELRDALTHEYYHFVINDDLNRAAQVTDEIIRRDDNFGYKDDFARIIAEKLLADIVSRSEN